MFTSSAITNISTMEPLERLRGFLNKFVSLGVDDFQARIVPYIEQRTFKKKDIISRGGEVENYINFIGSGLVRRYFVKDNTEIITQISREGQIIHCPESFYSRRPSEYFLDAIEPSSLLSISYDNLETIFSSGASMERMGRLIVAFVLVLTERWQMCLLKLSPRERFLQFVKNNSELMQRVPQKYLASLLNIQPETFSRFKHLLKLPPATSQP
jgi:CRP-like cAMP-binding protein